jgi:CheY-like chemotaxis protein
MIPGLLWILLAAVVFGLFYRPIRDELLPRLSSLKLPGGIELTLKDRIDDAAERQKVPVSEDDKTSIVRRLERLHRSVRGTRILWIDDEPDGNVDIVSILEAFGAKVELAGTSKEGGDRLRKGRFDVLISDIYRENQAKEGERFVQEWRKNERRHPLPPTIFYITDYDEGLGTPPYAFAITDRPHELLHYVLDVIERRPA